MPEKFLTSVTHIHADGVTNGTSDVTIVSAPAEGSVKHVNVITVDNVDTASATVRIFYVNGANSRRLVSNTLTSGSSLEFPTVESLVLDSTSTSIKLNLSGAVTTNELDWTTHVEEENE